MSIEDCEHHVQFKIDKEEANSHHEKLELTKIDENSFQVNLGYLKIEHQYQFSFDLQYDAENLTYLDEKSSKYMTFKKITKHSNNKYLMQFICFTHKEKKEVEQVYFDAIKKNPQTG